MTFSKQPTQLPVNFNSSLRHIIVTLEFNNDGSLKSVEIRIVNLQLDVEASKTAQNDIKKWEEIGVWQATPKKSNDVVGLGIGDGLNSAALPYNHGTYLIENHSH